MKVNLTWLDSLSFYLKKTTVNLQPVLENELVSIRPLHKDDHDALFAVASDPAIWEQHWTTDRWLPDGFRKFFDESLASGGCVVIIDQASKQIIGSSRFNHIEGISNAVEIGWSFLTKAYWGGQYNRSFKSLMINHALAYVDDVIFLIAHDNIRSQKATEKLGGIQLKKEDFPQYFRKEKTHLTYRVKKELG